MSQTQCCKITRKQCLSGRLRQVNHEGPLLTFQQKKCRPCLAAHRRPGDNSRYSARESADFKSGEGATELHVYHTW